MCDLSRKLFVVHKQEVDFLEVIDNEFFEAVRQEMSSLSDVPVPTSSLSVYVERSKYAARARGSIRKYTPSCCCHSQFWAWEPAP